MGSVSPAMIKAPINVFQRLARQWDEMHPYNAAQVLKIEGVPSPSALQEAWHDALNDLGLGRVGSLWRRQCNPSQRNR